MSELRCFESQHSVNRGEKALTGVVGRGERSGDASWAPLLLRAGCRSAAERLCRWQIAEVSSVCVIWSWRLFILCSPPSDGMLRVVAWLTDWLQWFTRTGECSKQVRNKKRLLWLWFPTSQVKDTHRVEEELTLQASVPQILIYSFSKLWWISLVRGRWCLGGWEPKAAAEGHIQLQPCLFHCPNSQFFSQFHSVESLSYFILFFRAFGQLLEYSGKKHDASCGGRRLLFSFWKRWSSEPVSGLCKVKLSPLSDISVTFPGP